MTETGTPSARLRRTAPEIAGPSRRPDADDAGVRRALGDGFTETGPTETIVEDPTDERTQKFISGELVY